jgi:hypothetical protein
MLYDIYCKMSLRVYIYLHTYYLLQWCLFQHRFIYHKSLVWWCYKGFWRPNIVWYVYQWLGFQNILLLCKNVMAYTSTRRLSLEFALKFMWCLKAVYWLITQTWVFRILLFSSIKAITHSVWGTMFLSKRVM